MEEKSDLFLAVLRKLQDKGILNEFVLIGSWCHYFYKIYFNNSDEIPLVRTLDLDFLVPNPEKIKQEVDIPELLNELGFETIVSYPSGYAKYVHPELSVEFLTPELGRGRDKPCKIKKLHINAQSLRFLNLLQKYVIKVKYKNITVEVPEPAVYVLHKFIIGTRRSKKEKAEKDLLSAKTIGEFLLGNDYQRRRLKEIFDAVPNKWKSKILKNTKTESKIIHEFLIR